MDINKEEQVKQFFTEKIQIKHGEQITKGDLYKEYHAWCVEHVVWCLSTPQFSKVINKLYGYITPSGAQDNKTGKRVWRNIYLTSKAG